jgi:hypothetical protein
MEPGPSIAATAIGFSAFFAERLLELRPACRVERKVRASRMAGYCQPIQDQGITPGECAEVVDPCPDVLERAGIARARIAARGIS